MTNYIFKTHMITNRFNEDWTENDQTYSTPEVMIMSTRPQISYDEWGQFDGTGIYLFGPNGVYGLEFEPVSVQRLTWAGGVTDVLWIDAHVRAGDAVIGFDQFYIELGGDSLPEFGSIVHWNGFMDAADMGEPSGGPFRPGREFGWVDAAGLQVVQGDAKDDVLKGGRHDDVIMGYGGHDTLRGYGDNDTLYGGDQNDRLRGDGSDDRLYGDKGNDRLWGDIGNDRLEGGKGADKLVGGAGNDTLNGGLGADTFVFGPGSGTDKLLDMDVGEGDIIQLDSALWDGELAVMDVINLYARFVSATNVVLTFDNGEKLRIFAETASDFEGLHGAIDIL